ncbi:DNA mismatch repair protein Msh2 [Bienertia sinuspersici]
MAADSQNPQNPARSFATESYHPMLQESIKLFLSQLETGISEFSHFNLMFSRLIQTMASPPIEVIWFYSAANFKTHKDIDRISALKELFHSLVSCTGPCCSSLKKVAVLAPLTFELYNLVFDLKKTNSLSPYKAEIGRLIERLVSFISLCCCEEGGGHDDTLAFSPCFVDLVKVWTFHRRESGFEYEDDFKMFFPFIAGEVCNGFMVGSRIGVLAGIVMWHALLLNLCLKEKDVLNLAASTIIGFRSCYFFDTLLKMLLESNLPVTTLLTVFDEILLRESMFDAIILVDYPFFNPGCGIHLCIHHLNSLASTWLFVADKAMQFVWRNEWLVQLRNQAPNGFGDGEFSMLVDKALNYTSEMKTANVEIDGNNQIVGKDDGVEDLEMIDSASGCNANSTAVDACGKRKGAEDEGGIRVKLLKYQIQGSPIKNFRPFHNEVGLIRRS